MKIQGQKFTNSATCHGVSFSVSDSPVDLAEITIEGWYPEVGWARNLEVHEMVCVVQGRGSLLLRDGETTELAEGDVVHVPAGEWFAWRGDMRILMACSPAFSPEQYETEEVK